MEQLDVNRITSHVAVRHGVILKPDDPAMVLVTISEVVLEDCFERLEKRARLLIAELDASFEDMQQRGASHLGDQGHALASSVREEISRDIQAAKLDAREAIFRLQQCYSHVVVWRWLAAGLVCGVSLALLGFAIGRIL